MASGRRAELGVLFAWNFAAVGAVFLGRTVRDAIFLATESPDRLPAMYIASPLVVTVVGLAWARWTDGIARDKLARGTALVAAALLAAAWAGLGHAGRPLTYALYVGMDVLSALSMMQFWGTAGERFTSREAKRAFGAIAAGGTAANIVLGLGISALVGRTGAEAILLLCAGLQLAVAGLAWVLARHKTAAVRARGLAPRREPVAAEPPGTRHLRYLAPLIVLAVATTILIDFQFKRVATASFAGDRVQMVRFFGQLSAATGVVALFLQLFVTGRVLARVGVAGALLALPATVSLGALGLLLAPSLAAATAGKAADATFRYTLHDAGMQLLYLPVPARVRARRKATLDAVIKPGAEALVGAGLLGYRLLGGPVAPLSAAALLLAAAWIVQTLRLRPAYVAALAETLRRRRLVDGAAAPSAELARAARGALADDAPAVRAAALAALADGDAAVEPAALARALGDPDDAVRAAAARAAAAAGDPAPLRALIDDPAAEVAAAAAAGLARHGDAADRAAARDRALARLDEPGGAARATGLAIATALADPALIPSLAARLGHPRDARGAAAALAAIGPAARPALRDALGRPAAAVAAARGLGALGDAAALADLATGLASPDEAIRAACGHGLAAARRRDPFAPIPTAALLDAQRAELGRAGEALAAADALGRAESALEVDGTRARLRYLPTAPDGPASLLSRTLRERLERARDRALVLADALAPGHEVDVVALNLRDPDPARRANAAELLEARLEGPRRRALVALADESPREAKLAALAAIAPPPRRTRDGWLDALLADDPWTAACAAAYAGAHGVLAVRPRLRALVEGGAAPADEAARAALARLDHPDRRDPMLSTTDRVMFLKGLELFAAVPGEELAAIAGIAAELALDEGEILFREGERGDALFLIVEGGLRLERAGRPLAELGDHDVAGEMALLDPAPRSATAIAHGATRLLRLGQDDFAELVAERPEVAAGVIRILTRRLRAASAG